MQRRVSQRKSLACRECTQRKRRCDKNIPCKRCTRLGLHCDREIVILRRDVNRNGAEVEFLESLLKELQEPHPDKIAKAAHMVSERIESLQCGQEVMTRNTPTPKQIDEHNFGRRSKHQEVTSNDASGQDSLIVTALEHITWGRSYGSCYPHRRCACQYHRNWSELSSINSQSFEYARSPIAAIADLPDRRVSEILVSFHIEHIAWHHNCIHSPTFLQQCTIFWETGECDQLQWVALYCSVLATSLFCLQNSGKHRLQYLPDANAYSPQKLLRTMTHVLYESEFLQNVSLYSIQAIVISTEVAHNLGLSQLNATLFNAAIRMAECLGLHKISDDDGWSHDDTAMWPEILEKEVGRRVWLQMVIQDHFAIPFTDSYGIHPAQYSTRFPGNSDDDILEAMPDSVPTVSTYTRVLGSIAQLMPELADGMGPLKNRKPLHEQYEHVLLMDQKMRQVVREIPRFLLQQDPLLEAQLSWLGIARQSLAITAAEKIIMIHRPFIFRSFRSTTYTHTRQTCVSAAMTILREHKNITDSGELSLWTHTAFCITAALILSFEVMCANTEEEKSSTTSQRRALYSEMICAARQRLAERINDVLAQRGVLLIGAIFQEPEATPRESVAHGTTETTMSFEEIVARLGTDWAVLGLSSDIQCADISLVQDEPVLEPSSISQYEEFNSWFEDMFLSI